MHSSTGREGDGLTGLYADEPEGFGRGKPSVSMGYEGVRGSEPRAGVEPAKDENPANATESSKSQGKSDIIQDKVDTFIKDLPTGKVNTKISPHKQARHLYGSNEYKRYEEQLSHLGDKPSYILEGSSLDDLAEMVKGRLGTGIIDVKNDNSIQAFIECDDYVGYWYDKGQKKFIATKRVQVKYALGGGNIHIIPVMERK